MLWGGGSAPARRRRSVLVHLIIQMISNIRILTYKIGIFRVLTPFFQMKRDDR